MSLDRVLILIMAIFSAIGGLDRVFGNRLKLGQSFENGFRTMGDLALCMVGMMVLSPLLADVLEPVIVPVYGFLGADPAIFVGTILPGDMGGAQLAYDMADSREAGQLGGIITSFMLGGTVAFTIPVAMSVLQPQDRAYGAKGILCGVITIPVGTVAGGLTAGFGVGMVLSNSVPIILISALIALGLWKAEKALIKGFMIFGKCIVAVATVGLVAAGVERTTGFVLIEGLGSLDEALIVVGEIAVVLSGAFPLIAVLTILLRRPLEKVGQWMGINSVSVSGLLASMANSLATFDLVKDMDVRGKIVNMAFAVSGAFVFGDHLAFTAGFDAELIPALIVGKLCAAATSVAIALLITREKKNV